MKRLKPDVFVTLILISVIVAYFFPQLAFTKVFPINKVISIGITLIFFFYGLKLSISDIKNDLKNIKLHILIQLSTFLLFPILVLLVKPLITSENGHIIWLSFMFLAALPSTVSSSVVMVSMAKGNVPAAIFNATISGLIGIVVTPFWMGWFVQQNTGSFEWGPIYLKLVTEILLPVLLGLLLQHYFSYSHTFTKKYNKAFNWFDRIIILLIVYNSFAGSFKAKIFQSVTFFDLILILISVIILFLIVYFITGYFAKKLKFETKDAITVQFCGTKKSLLHGTVFSKVIFGTGPIPMGIILLPIMLFHTFQIFVISIIATQKGKREHI
jgi:sodium/bile acid cotransporter 7